MAQEGFKRKLTAILSADVAGYSRLMREDEEATVRTLTTYRTAMTHMIEQYRGRVVDSPGDNILAEFTSVVDAVNCAVEIQRELAERNAELSENRRMQFRIGINLGDVLEEGKRIYGDGVNIAARMEGLAEVGGICISGTVFDAIQNKIGLEYEFLGEHEVKNIDTPIRAYRVLSFPGAAAHRVVKAKRAVGRTWRNAFVAIAVLVIAAVGVWYFYFRPAPIEVASVESMAHPLPDKPSIAVLPFDNMSKDPDQEYFSDGLTEDIIAGLSQIPDLFVIARNSTFTYKGEPVKVRQVSEELGVRYVLEGSVRKSEDRIRVTAQLIDALSGKHVWAETYDRELKDVFAVTDEITFRILRELHVKMTKHELYRTCSRGTNNVQAYLKHLQGMSYWWQANVEANAKARQLFQEAAELDPNYSMAYGMIAFTHVMDVAFGSTKSPKESLEKAFELAQKSLTLDAPCAGPNVALAFCYLFMRRHDEAIAACEQAISLDPNFSIAHGILSMCLTYAGRAKEAMGTIETALRLNPKPHYSFFLWLGYAHYQTGMYEEALSAYKKASELSPNAPTLHLRLASAYSALGREKEAHAEIEEVRRLAPKLSIDYLAKICPYKNPADLEQLLNDLRKAGLK